jgi:hypothetical protein
MLTIVFATDNNINAVFVLLACTTKDICLNIFIFFLKAEFHPTRPPSNSTPLQVDTESFFDKKFEFISDNWLLPCESLLFKTEKFFYEPLEKLKDELNRTKNKLNDYELQEWNQHTTRRNPANEIIIKVRSLKCEFVTNAWCKMFEILNTYPVVDPSKKSVKSIHLCEAPGGFITSLNHYLKQHNRLVEFTWTATTLNPYYEGKNWKKFFWIYRPH